MTYGERRRWFAEAEAGVTRCKWLETLRKRGMFVGWEIKTVLTVRAVGQRDGLCCLTGWSCHWRCL